MLPPKAIGPEILLKRWASLGFRVNTPGCRAGERLQFGAGAAVYGATAVPPPSPERGAAGAELPLGSARALLRSFGSAEEEGRNVDSSSHQVNGFQCVISVILENPRLVTTLNVFSFCFLIILGSHFPARLRRYFPLLPPKQSSPM